MIYPLECHFGIEGHAVTTESTPKTRRRPKIFSGNIKIPFLHKILSLKKLVPLICPRGARGPLLATRLFVEIRDPDKIVYSWDTSRSLECMFP